jgi:GNAT superfamily N-acetyltransferase
MQKVREAAFRPVFRSFADIVGEAIAALAFAYADAEQAQMLNDLCKVDSDNDVLVAAVDGAIVGFLCFSMSTDKRVGEIGLNAVHPDHAGRGIGTRMYELVLARMKERGMALATVGTGGDPSHAPARRAYQKAGFASAIPSLTLYKLL